MIPRLAGRAVAHLRRDRSLVGIGAGALALAFGVVALPQLFPESAFRPLSELLAGPAMVVLFGLVAGALAMLALRRDATADEEREDLWLPTVVPERAHYDEHRTVGDAVDSVFGEDADIENRDTRRTSATGRIRETAIAVIAAEENCSRANAADRIDAGTWTDDPRAAAFLGGARHAPLRVRIRDWASGQRFERWATHAVEEVEAIAEGGRR
ncbi:DUF7269 family protein [Halorussus amylolyticus]|uniref:DUF7269 family protein n=1 Tax=Halorussus amylolyticus TaxID=1126242 RepID=UPI0010502144|nr:hypothetical protein [Halorussus amylolyticus]